MPRWLKVWVTDSELVTYCYESILFVTIQDYPFRHLIIHLRCNKNIRDPFSVSYALVILTKLGTNVTLIDVWFARFLCYDKNVNKEWFRVELTLDKHDWCDSSDILFSRNNIWFSDLLHSLDVAGLDRRPELLRNAGKLLLRFNIAYLNTTLKV